MGQRIDPRSILAGVIFYLAHSIESVEKGGR